jgi:hypothetical protein
MGPCHHSMARPKFQMKERSQMWRVTANILHKQSRTADKGCFFSLCVGKVLKPPQNKKLSMLRNISQCPGLRLILRYNISNEK